MREMGIIIIAESDGDLIRLSDHLKDLGIFDKFNILDVACVVSDPVVFLSHLKKGNIALEEPGQAAN